MALVVGIILILLSVWTILPFQFPMGLNWGPQVLAFLKGGAPILGIIIGLVAFLIGVADMKDKADAKKEE